MAVDRVRMQRIADATAKYRLPGAGAGLQPQPDGTPAPVTPMNLAQLRRWVEGHDGGIDVLA
ncbi:MAG: hypothetical protein PGN13_15040 [Patulibacter minatonensis]